MANHKYVILDSKKIEESLKCTCGNCDVYKELFHVVPAQTKYVHSDKPEHWAEMKQIRDKHFPDHVVYFYNQHGFFYVREDGTRYVYHPEKHLWEDKPAA